MLPVYNNGYGIDVKDGSHFFMYENNRGKFIIITILAAVILFGARVNFYGRNNYITFAALTLASSMIFISLSMYIYRNPNINFNSMGPFGQLLPDEESVLTPVSGRIEEIVMSGENHVTFVITPRPIIDTLNLAAPLTSELITSKSNIIIMKSSVGEVEIVFNGPKRPHINKFSSGAYSNFFEKYCNNYKVSKRIILSAGMTFGVLSFFEVLFQQNKIRVTIPIKTADRGRMLSNEGVNHRRRMKLIFQQAVNIGDVVEAGRTHLGAYIYGG